MINFSKLRELSLPYNCYEVGHTWTPVCSEAALTIGYIVFLEGMKIYAPLYLISQAVQRKFSYSAFLSTIQSICTSSFFLSFNGFAFIFIFCLLRKFMGKFYYLHCSYFPAVAASFLAILIERKNRRGPLALYVTNVASETMFRMAVARGLVKPMNNGEVYLFSTTMAFFFYIVRKHGFSKDFVSMGLRYLVGGAEAKQRSKVKPVTDSEGKENSTQPKVLGSSVPCTDVCSSQNEFLNRHTQFILKIFNDLKHECCPHPNGCTKYIVQGFLRPFIAGYLTNAAVRCLLAGKNIFTNPYSFWKMLTNRRAFNIGFFLGGFAGTFKLVNCVCRWMFRSDREIYAFPAAFLGGLFMQFFPSSTLALYLMWKLIEVSYLLGIEKGVVPEIRGSMLVLYACSTAVLFYAAVLEPHNLKPAYLKFLCRITHNRVGVINRHVLDIFGTHASKLYTNFWPELDLKYCSRVFQESVLLWLIH